MPRFVDMLAEGMTRRGSAVKILRPQARLFRLPAPATIRKWLGYIDQYILFPIEVRNALKNQPRDTLYVFTDQALGPWVPMVADRPHVIHCHDFLAQKSARGLIKANPTAWPGRCYQAYIRRGYRKGDHFISVSNKTRDDLHLFMTRKPQHSLVVYNGMNRMLQPHDPVHARRMISKRTGLDLSQGYLLHLGGNQWYKNRTGVIEIYNTWRSASQRSLPLIMAGKKPDPKLRRCYEESPYRNDIHPVVDLADDVIPFVFAGAELFIFPSLAEGFGWPIVEAMACGCPVITTDARPMTEVAGGAAFLIPIGPDTTVLNASWKEDGARLIEEVLHLTPDARRKIIDAGLINAKRFDTDKALDLIEGIYQDVLHGYLKNSETTKQMNKTSNEGVVAESAI